MPHFFHGVRRRRVVERPIGLWIMVLALAGAAAVWHLWPKPLELHNAFAAAALQGDLKALRHQWASYAAGARNPDDTADLCVALHLAACQGNESIVAQLLDWGVDPNCRSPGNRTPLMSAVGNEHSGEIARRLIAAGADLNAVDRDGRTALQQAVAVHDLAMAAVLREAAQGNRPLSRQDSATRPMAMVYAAVR